MSLQSSAYSVGRRWSTAAILSLALGGLAVAINGCSGEAASESNNTTEAPDDSANVPTADEVAAPPSAPEFAWPELPPAMPREAQLPPAAQQDMARWTRELKQFGQGRWEAWIQAVSPFRQDLAAKLQETPEQITGFVGDDRFLFFRRSLSYLTAEDLRNQPAGKNPWPVLNAYASELRARGIRLIFVPVPVKAAVYPERLSDNAPADATPYVNPALRRLMMQLAEAGVECLDLYPHFLEQRDGEPLLYQEQDTHWTSRGVELTADLLAERLADEQWLEIFKQRENPYRLQPVTCKRRGDIVSMLPPGKQFRYGPAELQARQVVYENGAYYQDDAESPILMLTDSYGSVFQYEDCKHAGIAAHLAYRLHMPIDLVVGQGMGPSVWQKLRDHPLTDKRVIIWIMTSRDLYDSERPWEVVKLPGDAASSPTAQAPAKAEVIARVVEATSRPSRRPDYPRAVAVHVYEILDVISGDLPAQRVRAMQLMVENRRVLRKACVEPGQVYRLSLQSWAEVLEQDASFKGICVLDDTTDTAGPQMFVTELTKADAP